MKTLIRSALALAAFLATPWALADEPLAPVTAKGVQVITVEQARALLGKVPFFDVRLGINYGRGHLKGATLLTYVQKSDKSEAFDASKDSFDIARLPTDKTSPIVFYSDGPQGWRSYKASVVSARAGYSNVKWMRDGTAAWTAKGNSLE